MSASYPSLTLGVKLRDIKAHRPWYKQYIHMASMNYFLNNNQPIIVKFRDGVMYWHSTL